MSVSNDCAGGTQKRPQRPLTPDQWRLARIQFETGDRQMTHERIAQVFDTSVSSIHKRAATEKWSKTANIVSEARNQLKSATERHLAVATDKAGAQIVKSLLDDLAPIIEREKRSQIKRAIQRSKRAQRRLDSCAKGYQVYDSKKAELVDVQPGPKDEMHIATAEDKYDNIIRRNLGMGDNQPVGGSISLNLMCDRAAVQVVSPVS